MECLVEIRELSKRFGPITAVDNITLKVARGEVLGFLGPNGAGKSTTMRIVTGFLPPSAGAVSVCGFDVVAQPIEVKRRIGYLPEGAPAYGDMTPLGLLRFVADIRGLSGEARRRRIDEVIERLALGSVVRQPIETLSKGFKRRVGLAQAILMDPDVLILDEPTDGLDPNQKHEVRELLRDMAPGKAIVVSTHILEEVEAVCTRAVIIARGRIVADETPLALKARSALHNAVGLRIAAEAAERAKALIEALPDIAGVQSLGRIDGAAELRALAVNGADILTPVREAVVAAGIALDEIYVERGELDDVFRALTQNA